MASVSGKTDRRLLVTSCESLSSDEITKYQRLLVESSDPGGEDSLTPTEDMVNAVWNRVLRKPTGSIARLNDDFLKLGGDSLSVIILVSTVRKQKINLTAQEIYKARLL